MSTCIAISPNAVLSLAKAGKILYNITMEFDGVKDIAIYGTDCVVDISRGNDYATHFISAREKYFDLAVDDGTLTVRQKSRNIFYRIILHKFEFKLILPKNFKGKLRFRNKNGGLYIDGVSFTDVELSTGNGKFDISDMSCDKFELKMSNGAVSVNKATASGSVNIRCANGNIKVESVSAPALSISCTNATLSAADVTVKKLECVTSNGAIDASGISADEMKLETENGKISAIPIGSRDDYKMYAETSNGGIVVDGVVYKKISDAINAQKRISAKTSNGDIDIRFM